MNEGWIILGICLIVVIGGALPLIRPPRKNTPLPPPKESLRDWRSEK